MIQFPKPVIQLIRALNRAGHEAYAVGGCVRDALLGVVPNDWDLTTSASPEAIKACFQNERVIETGIKHGTVTVMKNGEPYEITTYRKDGEYTDHRRPDSVEFVKDLREDLMRRDFTVNAMACHPETGLVDLFGGQEDLKNGVIRSVGEAQHRFEEDALRILRAVRFASTYDFTIEENTVLAAMRLAPTLENVSAERIFVELKKLLLGKGVERVLMNYSEILFTVLPSLRPMLGCPQRHPHHAYDVWTHTVKTIAAAPADPVYRLTMLLHDAGKPAAHYVGEDGFDHFKGHSAISRKIAESALLQLKSDRATMNRVLTLITEHDFRLPATEENVRLEMARMGADVFAQLFPVLRADFAGQNPAMHKEKYAYADHLEAEYKKALSENACVSISQLDVTGTDIARLGAKGPAIGETLKSLLTLVIRHETENERNALLACARTLLHQD